MYLLKLNNDVIDATKVTYLGKVDTIVKAHMNLQIYYFPIIVDGVLLNILCEDKEDAIQNYTKLETYLADSAEAFKNGVI